MGGASPRHSDRGLMLAGDHDVGPRDDIPFQEFFLFHVVPVGLQDREDRLRRGVGRKALPEHKDVERIETGRLERDVGGDLAGRVHLCEVRRQQQTLLGESFAPVSAHLSTQSCSPVVSV